MKKINLLIAIIFINCLSAGQIELELMKDLEKINSKDKINVIIILKNIQNIDFSDGLSRKQKLKQIKNSAIINQEYFEKYLDTFKAKDIVHYKYYWIFNGYIVKATKEFIIQVSKRDDIELIERSDNYSLIETENIKKANSERDPDWNLEIMNIPEVWELGFCGEGQTIGIMDTGFNPNHPALVDKWSGLWFDAAGEFNEPTDVCGHGTLESGLVVGGDGSGPFEHDTGVAPNAEFAMAAISHSNHINSHNIFSGFQWFASLLDDGVDIRILSCSFATGLQSQSLWNTIQTLKQLDFIPVFAAGNGGSYTPVMCPASFPTVLGVGATDINDEIGSFSSQGPAPDNYPWNEISFWENSDWNLIKPDICAPGVAVQSTSMDGGYEIHSGTSLSTPQLSGIIALMLQKNPSLQYNQIYNILLETTVPLGETSPNNTFGWGRIDALAAIEEVSQMENEYLTLNGNSFNETPNPGTLVELIIGIKSHLYNVQDVSVTISCDNSQIQILNNSINIDEIIADSTIYNTNDPFIIDINESCLQGNLETLLVEISTSSGLSFSDEINFSLGEPVLTTIFFDDFENGTENWIFEDNWQINHDISHSPNFSMKNQFVEHINPPSEVIEISELAEPFDLSESMSRAEINFWINYQCIQQMILRFIQFCKSNCCCCHSV